MLNGLDPTTGGKKGIAQEDPLVAWDTLGIREREHPSPQKRRESRAKVVLDLRNGDTTEIIWRAKYVIGYHHSVMAESAVVITFKSSKIKIRPATY